MYIINAIFVLMYFDCSIICLIFHLLFTPLSLPYQTNWAKATSNLLFHSFCSIKLRAPPSPHSSSFLPSIPLSFHFSVAGRLRLVGHRPGELFSPCRRNNWLLSLPHLSPSSFSSPSLPLCRILSFRGTGLQWYNICYSLSPISLVLNVSISFIHLLLLLHPQLVFKLQPQPSHLPTSPFLLFAFPSSPSFAFCSDI